MSFSINLLLYLLKFIKTNIYGIFDVELEFMKEKFWLKECIAIIGISINGSLTYRHIMRLVDIDSNTVFHQAESNVYT